MITLYGAGAGFGLPEISPFVTKTEVQLRMAGLAYRKQRARPADGPMQQIPFIDDDGVRLGDSTFIRAHLERKHGFDLDDGLSPVARAQSWAIERMLEDQLYWIGLHARWLMPANFEKGPAHFFDAIPEDARDQAREEVLARTRAALWTVGVGRRTPDEITALGDRSLLALSEMLGAQSFLFGSRPTGVDATAFGVLAAIMTPFFDSPIGRRARGYSNLIAYVDRMMWLHFPRHDWPYASALVEHAEEID